MKPRVFSAVGPIIALFSLTWFLRGADIPPSIIMSESQWWETASGLTFIVGNVIVTHFLKA